MSHFDDRRDAFENKHVHEEALRFKIDARANRLLGEWVASQLGLTGKAAAEYVEAVIHANFEEPGREDVYRKVAGDLGNSVSESEIRQQMDQSLEDARRQVLEEA